VFGFGTMDTGMKCSDTENNGGPSEWRTATYNLAFVSSERPLCTGHVGY